MAKSENAVNFRHNTNVNSGSYAPTKSYNASECWYMATNHQMSPAMSVSINNNFDVISSSLSLIPIGKNQSQNKMRDCNLNLLNQNSWIIYQIVPANTSVSLDGDGYDFDPNTNVQVVWTMFPLVRRERYGTESSEDIHEDQEQMLHEQLVTGDGIDINDDTIAQRWHL